ARARNSAAVQRPSTPAPTTTMSQEEVTPGASTGRVSKSSRIRLFRRHGGAAGLGQTGAQGLVLIPKGLGQALGKGVVEGRNARRFLAPDLDVDVQQRRQILIGQIQSREVQRLPRRNAADRRLD